MTKGRSMKKVQYIDLIKNINIILEEIYNNNEKCVILKQDKPFFIISPYLNSFESNIYSNPLKDSIIYEEDIVKPIDTAWSCL